MTSDETARELHEIEEFLALLEVCCSDDDVEDWLQLRQRRQHLLPPASDPHAPGTVVDLARWREDRAASATATVGI